MGGFIDAFSGGSKELKSVGQPAPTPPTQNNPAVQKEVSNERKRAGQGNRASTIFTNPTEDDLGAKSNAKRLGG